MGGNLNLLIANLAKANIIAMEGTVVGWTLVFGRYGTVKTRASVLAALGARIMP